MTLAVEAMPTTPVSGQIARLSPAVNPQTRSFPLEGRVPNAAGEPIAAAEVEKLADGMRVTSKPARK